MKHDLLSVEKQAAIKLRLLRAARILAIAAVLMFTLAGVAFRFALQEGDPTANPPLAATFFMLFAGALVCASSAVWLFFKAHFRAQRSEPSDG
jgi:hypothetical protein